MATLGERIATAREAKNMLQSELAELVGVKSSAVISNWETDKNKPDAEKLVGLCGALDVTLSYLLDYHGKDTFAFTIAEKDLIKKLRKLPPHVQETIYRLVDLESEARKDDETSF